MKLTSIQKAESLMAFKNHHQHTFGGDFLDSTCSWLSFMCTWCGLDIPAGRDIIDLKCDDYSRDKDSISKQTRHKRKCHEFLIKVFRYSCFRPSQAQPFSHLILVLYASPPQSSWQPGSLLQRGFDEIIAEFTYQRCLIDVKIITVRRLLAAPANRGIQPLNSLNYLEWLFILLRNG